MGESRQVILEHHEKKKKFNIRPGRFLNLACHFFRVRVATIVLRPGDFVKVTCKGRTVIVFNSFRAFNRGTIIRDGGNSSLLSVLSAAKDHGDGSMGKGNPSSFFMG